jgi:hypothetical protein
MAIVRLFCRDLFRSAVGQVLVGQVVSFHATTAEATAVLAAERQRSGRSLEIRDVKIAGIAAARRATLATRTTLHFEDLGLPLVVPSILALSA